MIDALKARAEEGIWGYTSRPDSYYEAVCGWQKRRNGWDIDKSMISFNLGVVPALSSMVYVFTEPGDKVLIQTPVYSEFYDVTESWGREVVESPLKEQDGRWAIDFEDFEEKAKEAKIFFSVQPPQPPGYCVDKGEELERMCNICIANNVLIVSDEIHSDLVFHGKKHIPTATLSPEIATHVISCISGTKTFNLAGLQASATIFPNQKLKARFDKFWFNLDIHRNNAFSTIAMEVAFNEGEEWLEQLLGYIGRNFEFN
ncbi:MAG: MalY/PatB family protein [Enterocloster clostridioformis]